MPLIVQVYSYKNSGDHKLKGQTEITIQKALQSDSFTFKHNEKSAGSLKVSIVEKTPEYSFMDYLKGG